MSEAPISPQKAAELLLKRRRARESFTDFCRLMQPDDMQPAAPHVIITEALDRLEKTPDKNVMLLCVPGLGKSTFGSGLFPAYFMGRNPKASIIAATHTATFSETWGRRVRNTVADPKYQQIFPDTQVASDSAAAGQWATSAGGSYFAVGVGGRVQGRRADLLLIDDPIGSREDAESSLIKDNIWNWLKFDALARLKPGGKIVLIQTRYAVDDMAGRLLESEPDNWEVIKLKAECEEGDDDPLGRKPGDRIWPEYFTQRMIDRAKEDPRTWTSLYQQNPVPIGGGEFKKSWVQFYDTPNFNGMPKIILVDPAGGKSERKGDFTSMWVVALGEDDNLYIVDIVRDRLNLSARTELLFRLHKKFKPVQTRYESYSMQSDVEHIKSEMANRNYRFPITEVGFGGKRVKKEDRIRRLVPWFERGKVWFPREFNYTDSSGKMRDLVQVFMEEELGVFPVGAHDDMIDALSRIAEPTLPLPWPSKTAQFEAPVLSFGCLDPMAGY